MHLSLSARAVMLKSRIARLKVVVAQDAFVQTLVSHGPRPCTTGFPAEQALRAGRLLEHAVFLHGFHLVAGGVGEEVLKVLIFEGESVAGNSYSDVSL
jgi:hypothetical protein